MASINLQGDTSGSISISAPSVAGSNTLTLPKTTQTLATENALGVRNLIINGDMRIAQRATSVTSITSEAYYTIDRMRTDQNRDQLVTTQEQSTDAPDGFTHSHKVTVTTAETTVDAGNFYQLRYNVEGLHTAHLNYGTSSAQTTTLSFYVKASQTGTYAVTLSNSAGDYHFPMSYTVNSANTWERKTITITGATSGTWLTTNAIGASFRFGLAYGSTYNGGTADAWLSSSGYASAFITGTNTTMTTTNATWQITGIQWEIGDTATPFEHRPFDMELERCKRYYQKSYEYATAPGTATDKGRLNMGGNNAGATASFLMGPHIRFSPEMRSAPTMYGYDGGGAINKISRIQLSLADSGNNAISIVNQSTQGCTTYSGSGASRSGAGCHFTADAEL